MTRKTYAGRLPEDARAYLIDSTRHARQVRGAIYPEEYEAGGPYWPGTDNAESAAIVRAAGELVRQRYPQFFNTEKD